MSGKNCLSPGVCVPTACVYKGKCDEEFWKLLRREGIQVAQAQDGTGGIELSLSIAEQDIVDIHANGSVVRLLPDQIPASLNELLASRDITKLVQEVRGRIAEYGAASV